MAAPSAEPSLLRRFAPRIGLMLAALLILALIQRPDDRLRVFFPALRGDAALVQTPNGLYLLIDGGSDPDALVTALGRRMPFWQRDLALVILTSPGEAGQVAALERYRAHRALALPSNAPNATRDAWRRLLARDATPVRALRVGQRLEIDGVTIQTLDCDDAGRSFAWIMAPPALFSRTMSPPLCSNIALPAAPHSWSTPGSMTRILRSLSPSIRRQSSSAMGASPGIRRSRPTTNVQLAAHACTTNGWTATSSG